MDKMEWIRKCLWFCLSTEDLIKLKFKDQPFELMNCSTRDRQSLEVEICKERAHLAKQLIGLVHGSLDPDHRLATVTITKKIADSLESKYTSVSSTSPSHLLGQHTQFCFLVACLLPISPQVANWLWFAKNQGNSLAMYLLPFFRALDQLMTDLVGAMAQGPNDSERRGCILTFLVKFQVHVNFVFSNYLGLVNSKYI